MKVLFWGSVIFCFALLSHLVLWKACLPKRQVKALLQIFSGTLIVGILFLWGVPSFTPGFGLFVPLSLPEHLHVCLFFISLSLVYVTTYPGIEADSPSLVMVLNIAGAGPEGLSKEVLYEAMNDDLLIKPRVMDLVNGRLAYMEGDRYRLTARGTWLVRIFIFYRRLLNAPKGG